MAIKSQHSPCRKLQKAWNSQNVYDTLMPLYKTSRIMGLSPYSYQKEQAKHHYAVSKLGMSYSFLFIVLYIAFFSYASTDHNKVKVTVTKNSKVANFIDTFQWYATVSAMVSLILANCCHQNIFISAVSELYSIDNEIDRYGLIIKHSKAKREVIIAVLWQVMAFIIMECLNCSLVLAQLRITPVICYILCYIPLLISGFVKSQFIVLVVLLRYRFETINDKLRTLTNKSNEFLTMKIHPLQFVQANSTPQIISTVRKLHGKLCNAGCLVNKAFSSQILCIVGYNFVSFTAHAYFCMESFMEIYMQEETLDFELITTTMWAVVKLTVLLHLTYTCTQTKNEASESGVIIHKVQNRYQIATLDEITAFSKQILHWDFKFTAFGLFEIDMSIFYLMITSATTYLIILIQMDVAVDQNRGFLTSNITLRNILN